MQYLLMAPQQRECLRFDAAEQQKQGLAAYTAYSEALRKAGALKDANRLQPTSTATTVRVANGKSQVLNGPYADSKEQFGGYFLINVPDLDVGAVLGGALPRRGPRRGRGAAVVGHVIAGCCVTAAAAAA